MSDFEPSDPESTGQVLEFRVVPSVAPDPTTPPQHLVLPAITPLPPESLTRPLALIEKAVSAKGAGEPPEEVEIEGRSRPSSATSSTGCRWQRHWGHEITENPTLGSTEVWEFYNTTADAHPMHVHEITFQVVNREGLVLQDEEDEVALPIQLDGNVTPPEAGESGFKDTVIAYPGQVTRIKAKFDSPGQFVWHCHIVEHEDNEMMRPYRIGPEQPGQPDLTTSPARHRLVAGTDASWPGGRLPAHPRRSLPRAGAASSRELSVGAAVQHAGVMSDERNVTAEGTDVEARAVDEAERVTREWDERYAAADRVWSGEPNGALVREVVDLRPGRALDVGCGEGADAIWLAQRDGR